MPRKTRKQLTQKKESKNNKDETKKKEKQIPDKRR
jgi:hypothetical protein